MILLDILAYNTHYNALYTNLAVNEAFLDSASKRNSVVSKAKELGYVPRSYRCSKTLVNVLLNFNSNFTDSYIELPKYTRFYAKGEPQVYHFYTTKSAIAYKNGRTFHFKDLEMLALADKTATQSFDYSFQMGACLGLRTGSDYKFITTAFNQVIPYQTYALHHGNSREKNHSLIHDTNHYDTIHAEMQILIKALSGSINLDRTSLFVNLLPCPNCARTLSQTNIAEFVYLHDHSSAYAVDLLQKSGKIVRRLVI